MNRPLTQYLLIALALLSFVACRQAKYVAEEDFLLKKNKVKFVAVAEDGTETLEGSHPQLDGGDMNYLIRPVPNRSLKLFFYNRIDTTKYNEQVDRREEKYRLKNEKRRTRELRINEERIAKARENGDSLYRRKVIQPKEIKLGWRNWVRTNMGQEPVMLDTQHVNGSDEIKGVYFIEKNYNIQTDGDTLEHRRKVDSIKVDKMKDQLRIYMLKRGFYSGEVSDSIIIKKRQKAIVQYQIKPGLPYRIREVKIDSSSMHSELLKSYAELIEDDGELVVPGALLDQDVLNEERERFSLYCRNEGAFYGFNKNYVGFMVDTTVGNLQADVTLFVKPKFVSDPKDSTGEEKIEHIHLVYRVKNVTFFLHNRDEYSFEDFGLYMRRCDSLVAIGKLDSLTQFYRNRKGEYPLLDTLNIPGKGIFVYNQKPFVDPSLLDKQNFLEIDRPLEDINKYYKEYYVERSYRTLTGLGIFSNISPRVMVDPNAPLSRYVVVEYDLTPLKKQSFMFAPRLTNTNSIVGIRAETGYTNKNLMGGAQAFTASLVGSIESQPLFLGIDETGEARSGFDLNTFEIGPKFTYTVPRMLLVPKRVQETFSKRLYPKTVFDLTGNFQKRPEYGRILVESGFNWNFKVGKTQEINIKWIELSFVDLTIEDFFQAKLINFAPADLYAFTDHLNTITSASWHYNNLNSNRVGKFKNRRKDLHDVTLKGSIAGWGLTPLIYNGFKALDANFVAEDTNGLKTIFGLPYTQFFKLEAQYIGSFYINPKHRIVGRAIGGVGVARRNSPSLPFEQAFYAGGSNDIRAFEVRTVGPGTIKTYADTNLTKTQIGDVKLEANLEWRFEMTSLLEGAVFVDAGNIWNIRTDTISADAPEVFKSTWLKELALGVGYGVRADFDFLIIRVDLSFALHNPYLPVGERWFWNGKNTYESTQYFEMNPETGELIDYILPHPLRINFGIGYPF